MSTRAISVMLNDGGRLIGEANPRARYLDEDVEYVRALRAAGLSWTQVSQKMGIPVRTCRDYVSGRIRAQSVAAFGTVRRKEK